MRKFSIVGITLIACLVAVGGVAFAAEPAPLFASALASCSLPTLIGDQVIGAPGAVDEDTGCSAMAQCVYPPPAQVSCTSEQAGTCSASDTLYCGSVTCNGVTTKCAGYCSGDARCVGFCAAYYGPGAIGECDVATHCCVC
jgi:hypothetical protein